MTLRPSQIRQAFGNDLDKVRNDALDALTKAQIPSLTIGGYAVQEYGYHRNTTDVDIIVPDRAQAHQVLISSGKFEPIQENQMTVLHRETKLEVDIVETGKLLDRNCVVPMPHPSSEDAGLVTLQQLIELKLDAYQAAPTIRAHDLGDVVALIRENQLPQDYLSGSPMNSLYVKTWRDLQRELKARLLQ